MSDIKKKTLVLVVDDQPKILRFIQMDLRIRGYDVITAISGQEALDLVKSARPHIMLLDVVMPGIDGFQVLKEMRIFSDLPIIVFSASPENHDRALQLGANDFMPKPFDADEMDSRIKKLIPG